MAQGKQWLNVVIFTEGGVATPASILILSAASPPQRPQPPGGGTEPPLGIWGPTDPRPTHPIAGFDPIHGTFPDQGLPGQPPLVIWGPSDPRPTLPIAGWNPGTGNFPGAPGGGGGGELPPQVVRPPSGDQPGVGVVRNSVEGAGTAPPADAVVMDIYFGKGTMPTKAWVAPYAAQNPQ